MLHDAPDATLQDLGVVAHILGGHHKGFDREVGKAGNVEVALLVQVRMDLVDDGVLAQLPDLGLDDLGLVGTHVVLGQDLADALHTLLHHLVVIGGAVHAQQVLEHEGGHVGAALHKGRQVLHDLAAKVLEQLTVQPVHVVALISGASAAAWS